MTSTSLSFISSGKMRIIRPVVAALLVALVGAWLLSIVETSMKGKLEAELKTILRADVLALDLWLDTQQKHVEAIARSPRFRPAALEIAGMSEQGTSTEELLAADASIRLHGALDDLLRHLGYVEYVVTDRGGRNAAALHGATVGRRNLGGPSDVVRRALEGASVVSRPFTSEDCPDAEGAIGNHPTMLACAPIHDDDGAVAAVLSLRIDPRKEFTAILGVARSGESGETYAFDEQGLMLSESRFDEDLAAIGLLDAGEESILTIEIRDPGGDLTDGFTPTVERKAQPLTRMAAAAVTEGGGIDVSPYNDYRGVPVIGAWTWLPDYGFGVATEVDASEAYDALIILRTAFTILIVLLLAASLAFAFSTGALAHMRRRAKRAEREAQQLGQYKLEKKIGAGGMGEVYLASHAMLRRPTAVKLLRSDRDDDTDLKRFEREVRLTARLTHPNTIAIFDYGKTPEGVFYYAMEYLRGVSLQEFITREGPLSEGRVIYLLEQVCSSLEEAHGIGLIHRDIKPANVLLCRRGGDYDVIKVLDFGLVKDLSSTDSVQLSATDAISGTPMFLSPEQVKDPKNLDARADLYAVGAVAYFLITGHTVFTGDSAVEIIMHHVRTEPEPPSQKLGRPISEDLESLIMRCLAKERDERFANATELLEALYSCTAARDWGPQQARAWWNENKSALEDRYALDAGLSTPGASGQQDLAVDVHSRAS